jgi:RNA polymerase sigma-70 factor, ECF subfamily
MTQPPLVRDALETTEPELLAAARAGDLRALERLLADHEAQVYRFSMKMCRDPEDARDVLQNTLLTVARGIGDFRGNASLSTWLYTIARSFCIKKRRRSKYAPQAEIRLDGPGGLEARHLTDAKGSPEAALEAKEIERALQRAVDTLPTMYREVLILRDIEGLTAVEVAEVVGASVQAIKSRLHRARAMVREKMAPALGMQLEPPAAGSRCPEIASLFSRHVEGEVTAEVCAEMERHLAACPRCRDECETLERTLALCRAPRPAEPVPDHVQASVRQAVQQFMQRTS